MFMGSDGGILGIGGPELFTILLVGYFVLGPSDLYKLVKEIGKFITNIRTLGTDLSTTLESSMESTLQLEEIRKAQRELNDAFSFRRSINVNEQDEAFTVQAGSAQVNAEAAEAAAAGTTSSVAAGAASASTEDGVSSTRPKKIRRRVRRRPQPAVEGEAETAAAATTTATMQQPPAPTANIPANLEMPDTAAANTTASAVVEDKEGQLSDKELAEIEAEFDKYTDIAPPPSGEATTDKPAELATTGSGSSSSSPNDWFSQEDKNAADVAAQTRFQQQMSGNWNEQIIDKTEELEPMVVLMNKIASLEQEKNQTLERLEEEFRQKAEVEKQFFQDQRQLLEQGIVEVQSAAFGLDGNSNNNQKQGKAEETAVKK